MNVTTEERRYALDTPSGRNGVRGESDRIDRKVYVSHTFKVGVRNHVKHHPSPSHVPGSAPSPVRLPVGLDDVSISLSLSIDEGVDAVWT